MKNFYEYAYNSRKQLLCILDYYETNFDGKKVFITVSQYRIRNIIIYSILSDTEFCRKYKTFHESNVV